MLSKARYERRRKSSTEVTGSERTAGSEQLLGRFVRCLNDVRAPQACSLKEKKPALPGARD